MKMSIILLCIALLIIPSLSQPVNVGGTYGKNWLNNSGNKPTISNSSNLWDWGKTPIGHSLMNGKLVSMPEGNSVLIYPAFATNNSTTLIGNASLNAPLDALSHLTEAQRSSPYLYEDPWAIAQSTGQPILIQE